MGKFGSYSKSMVKDQKDNVSRIRVSSNQNKSLRNTFLYYRWLNNNDKKKNYNLLKKKERKGK